MSTNTCNVENAAPEVASNHRRHISPSVNIYADKDGYVIEAEMPGVNKDGLEVTLDGHELVLSGRREYDKSTDQSVYRESVDADYRRVFEIDPSVDSTRITAKIEQGLMTVKLPKAEVVKPRRITVSA